MLKLSKEDFEADGGEELRLAPALNSHPAWIRAAAALVRRTAPTEQPAQTDDHAMERGVA